MRLQIRSSPTWCFPACQSLPLGPVSVKGRVIGTPSTNMGELAGLGILIASRAGTISRDHVSPTRGGAGHPTLKRANRMRYTTSLVSPPLLFLFASHVLLRSSLLWYDPACWESSIHTALVQVGTELHAAEEEHMIMARGGGERGKPQKAPRHSAHIRQVVTGSPLLFFELYPLTWSLSHSTLASLLFSSPKFETHRLVPRRRCRHAASSISFQPPRYTGISQTRPPTLLPPMPSHHTHTYLCPPSQRM